MLYSIRRTDVLCFNSSSDEIFKAYTVLNIGLDYGNGFLREVH